MQLVQDSLFFALITIFMLRL